MFSSHSSHHPSSSTTTTEQQQHHHRVLEHSYNAMTATTKTTAASPYNRKAYPVLDDNKKKAAQQRPLNQVDYTSQSGPKLTYLWCLDEDGEQALKGQTLYLGGEVGSDGKIYYIPGHAPRVLQLDPTKTNGNESLTLIGPSFVGKFKWLRGVAVGDVIYGLPCHADVVLRIHVPSGTITTLDIPYEAFYTKRNHHCSDVDNDGSNNDARQQQQDVDEFARQQRFLEWKYHGGNISPIDGCIYALPQSALHVLRVCPKTDTCSLVGGSSSQPLLGRWKWYGGVIGKQDGAIYGIPHDSPHVLRILPNKEKKSDNNNNGNGHDNDDDSDDSDNVSVTLHGNFAAGGHKWHGAAAAGNGTIVCVPANADSVLCIQPAHPEPVLYEIGNKHDDDDSSFFIQTGRHRTDKKYKYLGATTGSNGKVYIFPSGSERVLQVDPSIIIDNNSSSTDTTTITDSNGSNMVQNIGPNIYDEALELICQNKWQNGVVARDEQCVYGIPLAAESVLRIDYSRTTTKVTTWPLPAPCKGLAKFEGAVVAPNGIIYTVPNNHKAVLRIQPSNWTDSSSSNSDNNSNVIYRSGIATLRSSAHRVKFAPKNRKQNPKPMYKGKATGTPSLPEELHKELVFNYNTDDYDIARAIQKLLKRCDPAIVGHFRVEETTTNGHNDDNDNHRDDGRLEDFVVPVPSIWRLAHGGQCETAQKYLSDQVAADDDFLALFDRFVQEVVLPHLKKRLVTAMRENSNNEVGDDCDEPRTFYYQCPPTLRLQPGPGWAHVKPHNDGEYGHQNGELNFWLPLTDRAMTGVDLWCESAQGLGDYHQVIAQPGQVISFHGSSNRHYVNANSTSFTRVSLDFRIGVEGFFDPKWQMLGTSHDHGRREVAI